MSKLTYVWPPSIERENRSESYTLNSCKVANTGMNKKSLLFLYRKDRLRVKDASNPENAASGDKQKNK